jgi:hypothetical protein
LSEKPLIRRVETDTDGHFYLGPDDKPVPGVTSILKALPKTALEAWTLRKAVTLALKGEESWDVPEGVNPTTWLIDAGQREALKAAKTGTGAHNFAEQYMLGTNPNLENLNKAERYHAECFLQFVRNFEPEPILVEKVVTYIDPKRGIPLFAGTIDLVAKLNDSLVWMIDYKASSSAPRPSHALQASAYSHSTHWLDTETGELKPMVKCDRAAVVLLNGGTAEKGYRAFELDTSEVVFSVFKSLLRIYNFGKIEDRVIIGEL